MIHFLQFVIVFFVTCSKILESTSAKLPSYIKPCNLNDPNLDECIAALLINLQPRLASGIPEMRIVPMDPLFMAKAEAHSSSLNAYFRDMKFYSVNKFSIKKFHFNVSNNILLFELLLPTIRQTGFYKINGKLLFMELQSEGTFETNYTQIYIKATLEGKRLKKNNKEYIKFDKIDGKVEIDDFHVQLDNIFPHNPELTKTTNDAINENKKSFLPEFLQLVEETMSTIALSVIQSTFDYFSIDELFSDN